MSTFDPLSEEVQWAGKLVRAGITRFRHADGEEVTREKVWHPGAVGILAIVHEHVWLTRQTREVISEPASLNGPRQSRQAGFAPAPAEPRQDSLGAARIRWLWRPPKSRQPSPGWPS